MDRRAKRQKFRKIEQKYKNEISKNLTRNAILNACYQDEKERADKYERAYYEQLKDEVVYNQKQVVTLSLMVIKDRSYEQLNFPKEAYNEYCKRKIVKMIAESLYNNYECLKIEETEVGTRVDAMLLKWNVNEQLVKEYERLKAKFEPFDIGR